MAALSIRWPSWFPAAELRIPSVQVCVVLVLAELVERTNQGFLADFKDLDLAVCIVVDEERHGELGLFESCALVVHALLEVAEFCFDVGFAGLVGEAEGFLLAFVAFAPDGEVFEWVLADDGDAVGLAVTKLGCGHVTTGAVASAAGDLGCTG